jgi:hypothetical protein
VGFFSLAGTLSSEKHGRVFRDQVIRHIENAFCATIGDGLVEQTELIPLPSSPTRREIAAFSITTGLFAENLLGSCCQVDRRILAAINAELFGIFDRFVKIDH